ncbi:MAG: Uma2 family endonuclease [Bacteroidota bacterium]
MITDINQLDFNKKYTYSDYLTWRFQERVELIKGKLFKMTPAPKRQHQRVSADLQFNMMKSLAGNSCQLYNAPFDVRLPSEDEHGNKIASVVQPDICVVCDESKLDDAGCIGAPDLIVEIISKSSSKKDIDYKFNLYQEHGVLEYWIVYPAEGIVDQFILSNSRFELHKKLSSEDVINSESIEALEVDLNDVFKDN